MREAKKLDPVLAPSPYPSPRGRGDTVRVLN
jgi:hypothetical protein